MSRSDIGLEPSQTSNTYVFSWPKGFRHEIPLSSVGQRDSDIKYICLQLAKVIQTSNIYVFSWPKGFKHQMSMSSVGHSSSSSSERERDVHSKF